MVLILQFGVAHSITEPYPAILLPAFSHAPENEWVYSYKIPKITAFKNGQRVPVTSEHELFNTLPPVYASTLTIRLFAEDSYLFTNDKPAFTPTLSVGTYNYFIKMNAINKRRKNAGTHAKQIVTYLRQKIPFFEADSLQVQWIKIETNLQNNKRDSTRMQKFSLIF